MVAGRKKATRKKTTARKAGRKKTAKKAARKKTTGKKATRKKTTARKAGRKKTARKKAGLEELETLLIQTLGEEQYKALTEGVTRHLQSDEYKKAVAEQLAISEREERVIEEAPWFGNTGLPEDLERELPRYLRREFGETIFDEDSLKASDLRYLGNAQEGNRVVHYWRVDHSYCGPSPSCAYIEVDEDGSSETGWGDRELPRDLPSR